MFQKWIIALSQNTTTNVLSKNASVFVGCIEVFLNSFLEIALACMRANANYAFQIVTEFSIFKDKIEPVYRKVRTKSLLRKSGEFGNPVVQMMAR